MQRYSQAQSGGSGVKSMLSIIRHGMEWPAYFILMGSLVTISLIVEHFVTVRRVTIMPAEQIKKAKTLIEGRNFRDCLDRTIQGFEIWCGQKHPGRNQEYIDDNKAKLVKLKAMK